MWFTVNIGPKGPVPPCGRAGNAGRDFYPSGQIRTEPITMTGFSIHLVNVVI